MNIYLTESEYDAISFAWSKLQQRLKHALMIALPLKLERLSTNCLLYKTNTEKQKEKAKYSMQ